MESANNSPAEKEKMENRPEIEAADHAAKVAEEQEKEAKNEAEDSPEEAEAEEFVKSFIFVGDGDGNEELDPNVYYPPYTPVDIPVVDPESLKKPYITYVLTAFGEKTLLRNCLNSLVYQGITDIEILVVNNNGDDDGTNRLIEQYTKTWDFVTLYPVENATLPEARRLALSKAAAPYIYFISAENWLSKQCSEFLLDCALYSGADVIFSRDYTVNPATKAIRRGTMLKRPSKAQCLEKDKYQFDFKLFKTDFLKGKTGPLSDGAELERLLADAKYAYCLRSTSFRFYSNDILPDYPEGEDRIPKTVYLNGFGCEKFPEDYQNAAARLFKEGAELIILNESTCDVHENSAVENAYHDKNFSFVAQYFGAEKIYQAGGIFMDRCMIPFDTFDNILACSAFFAHLTDEQVSPHIFGAEKGHIIFQYLLRSYETDYFENQTTPLAERIKHFLIVLCAANINGKSSDLCYGTKLFSSRIFTLPIDNIKNLAVHDFSKIESREDCRVIPESVYRYIRRDYAGMVNHYQTQVASLSKNLRAAQSQCAALEKKVIAREAKIGYRENDIIALQKKVLAREARIGYRENDIQKLEKRVAVLENRLNKITNSFWWKIAAPIRSLARRLRKK